MFKLEIFYFRGIFFVELYFIEGIKVVYVSNVMVMIEDFRFMFCEMILLLFVVGNFDFCDEYCDREFFFLNKVMYLMFFVFKVGMVCIFDFFKVF